MKSYFKKISLVTLTSVVLSACNFDIGALTGKQAEMQEDSSYCSRRVEGPTQFREYELTETIQEVSKIDGSDYDGRLSDGMEVKGGLEILIASEAGDPVAVQSVVYQKDYNGFARTLQCSEVDSSKHGPELRVFHCFLIASKSEKGKAPRYSSYSSSPEYGFSEITLGGQGWSEKFRAQEIDTDRCPAIDSDVMLSWDSSVRFPGIGSSSSTYYFE